MVGIFVPLSSPSNVLCSIQTGVPGTQTYAELPSGCLGRSLGQVCGAPDDAATTDSRALPLASIIATLLCHRLATLLCHRLATLLCHRLASPTHLLSPA